MNLGKRNFPTDGTGSAWRRNGSSPEKTWNTNNQYLIQSKKK